MASSAVWFEGDAQALIHPRENNAAKNAGTAVAMQVALFWAGASAFGLLSSVRRYFNALSNGAKPQLLSIAIDEFTAMWLAAFLLFIVVQALPRFPLRRFWWAYLAVAPVFAITHTLGMFGSRSALHPLFGLGAYSYGDLGYRFLMEAPLQLVAYALALLALALVARLRRARDAEKLEALLAEAQLEQLRLSIGPHFLFNALNTISATVYDSPERADELITRLSRLLRALLQADPAQTCTLQRELELVGEYLEIQKARFEDQLEVRIDCPPELCHAQVPFMILQPVVENALAHGTDSFGRLQLTITAQREADTVIVEVADRGAGPQGEHQGVGTRNTRERIRMLFGFEFGFELGPRPGGGALARMRLPWQPA